MQWPKYWDADKSIYTHTQTISSTIINTPTVAESFSILSRVCATKKKERKMNKENFLNG